MSVMKYKDPSTGEVKKVFAPTIDAYTKTETYSKTETDTLLVGKANASSVYTKTETDTLLSNKAPAGYGLGGSPTIALRTHDDVDNAKKIGWYTFYGYDNGTYWNIFGCGGGTIFVTTARNGFAQFLFPDGDSFIARRYYVPNSGWEPWECINPPMKLGVEYRTTERYQGKPVYVKLVDFGALPNTTSKYVNPNISNFEKLTEPMTVTVYAADGAVHSSPVLNDTATEARSWFKMASGGIAIRTMKDATSNSAVVKLKYTKTTD